MIAITFALPAESSGLLRKLTSRRVVVLEDLSIVFGQLHGRDVAILHTGVGRKQSQRNIEAFLGSTQPELLISSGFAGSLTGRLNVGDLIVARNFSDPTLIEQLLEGGAPATPLNSAMSATVHSPEPLNTSTKRPRLQVGTLFTTESMVDSVEERGRIAQQHGADAIDMETEIIAQACAAHRLRMLSLRVISDSADAPFPAPAGILFDVARQKTNFGKLIPYILKHPTAVARLSRFAGQISRARAVLTDAIGDTVTKILLTE